MPPTTRRLKLEDLDKEGMKAWILVRKVGKGIVLEDVTGSHNKAERWPVDLVIEYGKLPEHAKEAVRELMEGREPPIPLRTKHYSQALETWCEHMAKLRTTTKTAIKHIELGVEGKIEFHQRKIKELTDEAEAAMQYVRKEKEKLEEMFMSDYNRELLIEEANR